MAGYSDVLTRYNGGANTSAILSQLDAAKTKFGFTDEELGKGLDAFGQWHTGRFGGGFTNQSSAAAITNSAIQNALNARVQPQFLPEGYDYYAPSNRSTWEGGGPIANALNYAASPEQIKAHTVDDVMLMLQREKAGINPMDPTSSNFGYNLFAGYGGQQGWTDQDFQKIAQIVGDSGKSVNDFQNALKNRGEGGSWWGPEATMSYLTQQFGLDPSKYIDQTRLNQQQATAANTGQAAQNAASGGGDDFLMQALLGVGAGVLGGSFLNGAGGAAAEAGTSSLGSLGSGTFGLDVGLGGATGSLGSLGVGATGTGAVAAGGGALGSGLAGLGAADLAAAGLGGLAGATGGAVGNFVPAEAAGGTVTGSGGSDMSWLDDMIENLTGPGADTGMGAGNSVFDTSYLNQLPSGPDILDVPGGLDSVIPQSSGTPSWLSQIAKAPTSLLKSLGLSDSDVSMIGKLGAAGLGAYASNQQSNALAEQAAKFAEYGAPYRQQLASLQSDPGSFLSSPRVTSAVDQGTSAMARALSARDGNPTGSGRALQEMQNYATNSLYGQLTNRENQLANFGGLSNFNAAAPSANLASVQQTGNMYNAIGAGINDIFNPQPTYLDLIKAMKGLA